MIYRLSTFQVSSLIRMLQPAERTKHDAGLIVGGEPRDSQLVQKLAEEHIQKPSCIILLTIACESRFSCHLRRVAVL